MVALSRQSARLDKCGCTWRLAPVLLEGLRVRAETLVLLYAHTVGHVEVSAVETSLLLLQDLQQYSSMSARRLI